MLWGTHLTEASTLIFEIGFRISLTIGFRGSFWKKLQDELLKQAPCITYFSNDAGKSSTHADTQRRTDTSTNMNHQPHSVRLFCRDDTFCKFSSLFHCLFYKFPFPYVQSYRFITVCLSYFEHRTMGGFSGFWSIRGVEPMVSWFVFTGVRCHTFLNMWTDISTSMSIEMPTETATRSVVEHVSNVSMHTSTTSAIESSLQC